MRTPVKLPVKPSTEAGYGFNAGFRTRPPNCWTRHAILWPPLVFTERAFSIGTRDYLWLDVVLAAMWRGDWTPFEATLREGLACAAHAEATGEDAGEAADDLLTEFRYARDLIAAADAEAWLERVGLTAEQLHAYFERRVLRERWAGDLPAIRTAHPASPDDIADALAAEGVCSGAFDRFALTLAGRAALFERRRGRRRRGAAAGAAAAALTARARRPPRRPPGPIPRRNACPASRTWPRSMRRSRPWWPARSRRPRCGRASPATGSIGCA